MINFSRHGLVLVASFVIAFTAACAQAAQSDLGSCTKAVFDPQKVFETLHETFPLEFERDSHDWYRLRDSCANARAFMKAYDSRFKEKSKRPGQVGVRMISPQDSTLIAYHQSLASLRKRHTATLDALVSDADTRIKPWIVKAPKTKTEIFINCGYSWGQSEVKTLRIALQKDDFNTCTQELDSYLPARKEVSK